MQLTILLTLALTFSFTLAAPPSSPPSLTTTLPTLKLCPSVGIFQNCPRFPIQPSACFNIPQGLGLANTTSAMNMPAKTQCQVFASVDCKGKMANVNVPGQNKAQDCGAGNKKWAGKVKSVKCSPVKGVDRTCPAKH
jgi:hypothetical protein